MTYYLDPSNPRADGQPSVVFCAEGEEYEVLIPIPAGLASPENFPFLRLNNGLVELDIAAKSAATAADAAAEKSAADYERKLAGVSFGGVMCSATKFDQDGLMAVLMSFQLAAQQGKAMQATRFTFENGNTLVLSSANIMQFAATWQAFRQSFFAV